MKFYFDLMSQPSRAVYMFLNRSKIPFEKCPIAIRKGEHRGEEFTKINKFQMVPVIDDNGFILTESVAILRYLMKSHQGQIPDHWYPNDPKKQAKVDEYCEWQHNNTRLSCAMYFQHKLLIPLLTNSPPIEKKVEQFRARMETTLDAFENIWLSKLPFIAGSSFTIADLLAICELQQPGVVGYDVYKNRPKTKEWHDRVTTELQPQYDEASVYVEKFKHMYANGLIPIPEAKL